MTLATSLPKRMTAEEWNEEYFSDCEPLPQPYTGVMMIYQVFAGYVKFKGKRYRVVGWHPPGSERPYVNAYEVGYDYSDNV